MKQRRVALLLPTIGDGARRSPHGHDARSRLFVSTQAHQDLTSLATDVHMVEHSANDILTFWREACA